jgi:hypothetical protein
VGPRAGLDKEATGRILSPLPGIEPRSLGFPMFLLNVRKCAYVICIIGAPMSHCQCTAHTNSKSRTIFYFTCTHTNAKGIEFSLSLFVEIYLHRLWPPDTENELRVEMPYEIERSKIKTV